MGFNFVIKTQKDYQDFVSYLKTLAKNESVADRQRHIAILNTNQDVIGIAMSKIRETAKKLFKNGCEKFLEIGLSQSEKQEYYEETLIQGIVIAMIKDLNEQKSYFEKWIIKIDNWATCDSTVTTMKILSKSKNKSDYFDFYLGLCYKPQEFVSRFGIVVLMCCYLEGEYIDRVLQMCEEVISEAYYVNMAIAWLVSNAFVNFKEKVYKFLESQVLSKFTQNKTISKCRDSFRVEKDDKENLVKFRIK